MEWTGNENAKSSIVEQNKLIITVFKISLKKSHFTTFKAKKNDFHTQNQIFFGTKIEIFVIIFSLFNSKIFFVIFKHFVDVFHVKIRHFC